MRVCALNKKGGEKFGSFIFFAEVCSKIIEIMTYIDFETKLKSAILDYTRDLRRDYPMLAGIADCISSVEFHAKGNFTLFGESLDYDCDFSEIPLLCGDYSPIDYYSRSILFLPDKLKGIFFCIAGKLVFEYILKGESEETIQNEKEKWDYFWRGMLFNYAMNNKGKSIEEIKYPSITDQVDMFCKEIKVHYESDVLKNDTYKATLPKLRPLNREALLHDIWNLACSWEDIKDTETCKRWYELYYELMENGFMPENKKNKWTLFVKKVVCYCVDLNEAQVKSLASKLRDYDRLIGSVIKTEAGKSIRMLIEAAKEKSRES